ncbi:cold-regulated 413 inner membrane protein 2, chloroplastic-like [Aegilops tauschii subsp. strangulata]|nr:cold-regulated 413 inner membrane protein 2, chloroplastic-like [Aegilops tauschii subsp. strangulata]
MSISLRLAVPLPPSAQAPAPRRRGLRPRAGGNAVTVSPVVLRPPRALRGDAWWRRRGDAAVCCASAHISTEALQWIADAEEAQEKRCVCYPCFQVNWSFPCQRCCMLFVSIAPYQFMNLRGTQDSVILSLAIAAYLAFQHFTGAGGVRKALDHGAVVATLCIICITLIPFLFLL